MALVCPVSFKLSLPDLPAVEQLFQRPNKVVQCLCGRGWGWGAWLSCNPVLGCCWRWRATSQFPAKSSLTSPKGRIGIIDNDCVEISNLQRQILHTEETLGLYKADSAKLALQRYIYWQLFSNLRSYLLGQIGRAHV